MPEPLTVLFAGNMSTEWAAWVAERLDAPWRVLTWDDDEPLDELVQRVAGADVIVAGRIPRDGWSGSPALKLYHIPYTGFDWLEPAHLPAGCLLCNTFEHEIAIAEYVMAGMLEWVMETAATDARFRTHRWEGRQPGIGPGRDELYGKTLGIVGYGHIGRETAARARAFGMRIHAASRRPPAPDGPQPDHFTAMDGLDELLGASDFVLVTLPLSAETKGLFDAAHFAAMKPTGVIINVGRGRVLDEQALFDALKEKRIGGAIIDVWYQYPRDDDPDPTPSKFPFEDLDNIIMTPHSSARTDAMRIRRWQFVADNLNRFARGETPENIVFEGAG